ncbi:hypothetical protein TRFO_17926 [Tritrichomonas foetus]|uniref:RRM domain-containing protein n=1 Tax=Tritrichomonas foetus TaxID=1144522 RepID=A0A1J4KRP0_9EUKA|nr:hypothetical protein TRFO_17926 [Tritrichomonas foetus]|eukprot:OHT12334.1 hypothetical protein TRFO_17926 [Tritrichomonas foetus]
MSVPPEDNPPQEEQQEDTSDNITLYVNNLPLSCTDQDVQELFERFGKVINVCNRKNKKTGQFSGNSFVTLSRKEDGEKAIAELNDTEYKDRRIVVEQSNRPYMPDYKRKPNDGMRRPRDDRDRSPRYYSHGYRDDRYDSYRPPVRYDRNSYDMGPPPAYRQRYSDPYYDDYNYRRGGGGGYRDYPEYERRSSRYDRRDDDYDYDSRRHRSVSQNYRRRPTDTPSE